MPMSGMITNMKLRFRDAKMESAYVESCVRPQIGKRRRAVGILFWLTVSVLAITYYRSRALQVNSQTMDAYVLLSAGLIGFLQVIPWPRCFNEELVTVVIAHIMPLVVMCDYQVQLSKNDSGDPEYGVRDSCSFQMSHSFGFIASIVCATGLFPIRCFLLLPVYVLPAILYIVTTFSLGSQLGVENEILHSASLLCICVFLFYTRWQQEFQLRVLFASKQGAIGNILGSDSQQRVVESLEAMLGNLTDTTFHAGQSLQVVGHNARLDELLGPMHGLCLDERTKPNHAAPANSAESGVVQKELLQSEASLNSPEDRHTVYISDVSFAREPNGMDKSLDKSTSFIADVLVADTGITNVSADGCWRYIISLLHVRPQHSCKGADLLGKAIELQHNPANAHSNSKTMPFQDFMRQAHYAMETEGIDDSAAARSSETSNETRLTYSLSTDTQLPNSANSGYVDDSGVNERVLREHSMPTLLGDVSAQFAGKLQNKSEMKDSDTQTMEISFHDKAVETSVLGLQDFRCKCCMKPPTLPISHDADSGPPSLSFIGRSNRKFRSRELRSRNRSMQTRRTAYGGRSDSESQVSSDESGSISPASSSWGERPWLINQDTHAELMPMSHEWRKRSIQICLQHWNVHVRRAKCCDFHTVLKSAKQIIDQLLQEKCRVQWKTKCGWQCLRCQGCQDPQWPWCYICGLKREGKLKL